MIFAPVAGLRKANVTNTVIDVSLNPSTVPGYNFWGYEIDNTSGGAIAYLQVFNAKAADVTLGATVPDYVYAVNANTARGFGFGPYLLLNKGLSIAVTSTKDGNGAPASACDVTVYHEEK